MSYIYGLLKAVISALLNTMHHLTGNFGVAIILATIVIKIVLLPLTLKQDKSMKSMKKLQPELDKIKKQYKDDPQTMNQKTMELYKEHKVNPAGGCLPLLIQLPILWALFGVLRMLAAVTRFLIISGCRGSQGMAEVAGLLPVLRRLIIFFNPRCQRI